MFARMHVFLIYQLLRRRRDVALLRQDSQLVLPRRQQLSFNDSVQDDLLVVRAELVPLYCGV